MKHRLFFALAVAIPLVLFVVARRAANWRLQPLAAGEFGERAAPQPGGFRYDWPLSAQQQRWIRLARAQGWRLRAVSPDQKRLLAQRSKCDPACGGAVLSAADGHVLTRLRSTELASQFFQHWASAAFSPDGLLVVVAQSDVRPTLVFDARTGASLWSTRHAVEVIRFSLDSTWAAFPDANRSTLLIVEARTKRELRRLPYAGDEGGWGFSRDGDYLIIETAPGQFSQLRLR